MTFAEELVEAVENEIKNDLQNGDTEALCEMLKAVPIKNLLGYLPEDTGRDVAENHMIDYDKVFKNA